MKSSRGSSECRISDLPEEIVIDILSRLSIKTIFTCRCVSKTWHNVLSSTNPQFTKLHFKRSPVQIIIQNSNGTTLLFHIVECDIDSNVDNPIIKPFPSIFRLLSKYNLRVVNSCNGFMCLATNKYPVKICNPVTGEYLKLPKHKMYEYSDRFTGRDFFGFGFCAKTSQYKVVMVVYKEEYNRVMGITSFGDRMAEVYTIGTESWRTIGIAPELQVRMLSSSTTFFNGAIHWLCYDESSSDYIVSFDIESEKFGILPPPLHFSTETIMNRFLIRIGVLGEFLYLSYNMELWVMKEYGVQKSWTKVHVVDSLPVGSYQAIKYSSDGKILMNYRDKKTFCCWDNKLISYDPVGKICKEFKVPQFPYLDTFAHVPSFMSFNDAMVGDKAAKLRTMMCRA